MSPQKFVAKWAGVTTSERASAQAHFLDICQMLGVPGPHDVDPTGEDYAFEKGVEKIMIDDPDAEDGGGYADVWKRGHFAWEYKRKKKNLEAALKQLLRYHQSLENPPLLVVCDLNKFEVHAKFTNTIHKKYAFDLEQLRRDPTEPIRILRAVFTDPEALRPQSTPDELTEEAAGSFADLAAGLRQRGHDGQTVAHFLNRLVFCLFAEDTGLLPKGLLERIAEPTWLEPELFAESLRELFTKMSKKGGLFGTERIEWFNGGLFDSDEVLLLTSDEIALLRWVGRLDWSQINPAIFGTLFERGLDPRKRGQLGAHYTDARSIERVVAPVLIEPLSREFAELQETVSALVDRARQARTSKLLAGGAVNRIKGSGAKPAKRQLAPGEREVLAFLTRLRDVRVLDPACGSGNFLYVALKALKDLERDVIMWASETIGLTEFPRVGPQNVLGIEVNEYAAELARVTIWIGEIQWMVHNGFSYETDPILQPLQNIETRDALFDMADGKVHETEWPQAEFIIGNPPFLGGKFLRRDLGDEYVDHLFEVFSGRVAREADLVVYWFEKARDCVAKRRVRRVGLLATQGIRGGANRRVLEKIKTVGDIFLAWPDEPWIVEGTAVHVSIVGFDDGSEKVRRIHRGDDERTVSVINSNLTAGVDLTSAKPLESNFRTAFMGDTKGGPFDIPSQLASEMLRSPNPDGRPNSDVVRPSYNSLDITRRPRGEWIIDFPPGTTLEQAALYEAPFEYVKKQVAPVRASSRTTRQEWWIHERPRPAMRRALRELSRYIATPTTSKHRLFVWLDHSVLPDHQLIVFAKEDDFTFGVLHSRLHELWARGTGTQLREAESGFRYTPSTTFEAFPFPEADKDRRQAIADASAKLDHLRSQWLTPPNQEGIDLRKRTLTNLYNEMPTWLQMAHEELDAVVASAYGWEADLSDDEILRRLLALNLARSSDETQGRFTTQ